MKEFIRRGLVSCGFGPLVLGVIYLVSYLNGMIQTLAVTEVCTGIFSLSALAFIAGGMNVLYQIEKLPLTAAMFIHGAVLYVTYLAVYLINGWLKNSITPLLVFTVIFAVGYLVIWAFIYAVTKSKTDRINELLKKEV